jgi:uncharacterized protein with PQ loop repeat
MPGPLSYGEEEKDLIPNLKSSKKKKVIMSIVIILLISLSLLVCYRLLINSFKTIETTIETPIEQNILGCDPVLVFTYIWIGDNIPEKYKQKLSKMNYPYRVLGISDY